MHEALKAARRLAPMIRAAREEAERTRQTPPALAAEITRAGLYQLYLPRSMGGKETPPLQAFDAVEELSRADGSIGWCAMIAAAMSMSMGRLAPEVGREIAGTPADYRAAGSARPGGKARAAPGGYRISGRWNFASGISNARFCFCTCVVMDGDTPRLNPRGLPLLRGFWVPIEQTRVIDTWQVMGMRGTGSQDFVVEDVFVPAGRSASAEEQAQEQGPLYNQRAWFVNIWTPSAANALGIARGAIDTFMEIAARQSSTLSTITLKDRPAVQARLGEAEAIASAARAFVREEVGRVWDALCEAETDTGPPIARARLAITHAIHESVRAVDIVFHAAGTNAIYSHQPLERFFRDIHVAVQHGSALPGYYESAGKALFGLTPSDPGW